ncbi:hypothetical protein [Dongia sp. agr-C8]
MAQETRKAGIAVALCASVGALSAVAPASAGMTADDQGGRGPLSFEERILLLKDRYQLLSDRARAAGLNGRTVVVQDSDISGTDWDKASWTDWTNGSKGWGSAQ